MYNKNFYSDLRLEVIYRDRYMGSDGDPRMHLHDGPGMIPQFVIPNLLAARKLRDALDEVIKAEEKAAKKRR